MRKLVYGLRIGNSQSVMCCFSMCPKFRDRSILTASYDMESIFRSDFM